MSINNVARSDALSRTPTLRRKSALLCLCSTTATLTESDHATILECLLQIGILLVHVISHNPLQVRFRNQIYGHASVFSKVKCVVMPHCWIPRNSLVTGGRVIMTPLGGGKKKMHRCKNCVVATTRQRVAVRCFSTRNKIMNADDAVHLIRNGDTVAVSGFVGQSGQEEILSALARRYKSTGFPKDLTLLFAAGPADWKDKGINHFAHDGMLKRTIGSHYGQCPMIAAMVQSGKIEAYQLPLGSISRSIRAAAAKLPGHVTKVGFGTLADPKFGGGKLNNLTTENLVEEIEVPAYRGSEHTHTASLALT